MAACSDSDEEFIISRTSKLRDELVTLRIDGDFTDFTLKAGEKSVACHRVIIAANSPYLKAMLKSKMKETDEKEVCLDISQNALHIILNYMYSGEMRIAREMLQEVIEAADYLQMEELKEKCAEKAYTIIKPNNVISWFKFSDKMNLDELISRCSQIMISDIKEILSGPEFLELSISELNHYFSEAERNKVDPDVLLGAGLDWVSADSQTRHDVIEDLLKSVSLEKCSLQCVKEEAEKHAVSLRSNPSGYKLMLDAVIYIAQHRPIRKKRSPRIILIGGVESYALHSVPNDQCWLLDYPPCLLMSFKIPQSHLLHFISFCRTAEGFAMTSGYERNDAVMYSIKNSKWNQLTKPLVRRTGHASAFVKRALFLFGGRINGITSSSVHYLDESGAWHVAPDLPEKVFSPGVVCTDDDDVFLMDIYTTNKLFKMDVETKLWVNKATLPGCNCQGARIICVNERLYVAGGKNRILAWYGLYTDTWSHGVQPQFEHSFGAVVYQYNTILVIGGVDEKKVESYDLDTGVWSVCDWEMPKCIGDLHGLMIN